jgi:hypothetical protein
MSLARIAPGPSGFDIRTFECGGCHHVHIVKIASRSRRFQIAAVF